MTTYRVLVQKMDPREAAGPTFVELGSTEAHNPAAACLDVAAEHKLPGAYVAVPVRNWHETPIRPSHGFEIGNPDAPAEDPEPPTAELPLTHSQILDTERGEI